MMKCMAIAAMFLAAAGPAWANDQTVEDQAMAACLRTPNVNIDICYLQHLPEVNADIAARAISTECEKIKSSDGVDEYVAVCGEAMGYIKRRWEY